MSLPDKLLWVELQWADGGPNGDGYRFDISKIKHQRELEAKCDAGVQRIMQRLLSGDARVEDYRETIRLGLIGGGLAPDKAIKLVVDYVDGRPRIESISIAVAVLMTLCAGRNPDDAEDGDEAAEGKQRAPETAPTSEQSTAPELQSASIPAKSMN
jgi:hypothetical protein